MVKGQRALGISANESLKFFLVDFLYIMDLRTMY